MSPPPQEHHPAPQDPAALQPLCTGHQGVRCPFAERGGLFQGRPQPVSSWGRGVVRCRGGIWGAVYDHTVSPGRYKQVLGKARKFELKQHRVILCTCSCAASASLKRLAVRQILIDEAGMATEPETLIPLVTFSKAEKVSELGGELGAPGRCQWVWPFAWEGSFVVVVEWPWPWSWGPHRQVSGLCLPVPPGGSSWGPQAAAACGQERAAAKSGAGSVSLREVSHGRLPAGHSVPHGKPVPASSSPRCALRPGMPEVLLPTPRPPVSTLAPKTPSR